jgi:hypothetical protein
MADDVAPSPDPVTPGGVDPALPSVGARVLAFAAILVGGLCGGFIGYAFVDLQCTGECGTASAIGALVGGLGAAIGVAVVAVLALRAMGEWKTIQARPEGARPDYSSLRNRNEGSATN